MPGLSLLTRVRVAGRAGPHSVSLRDGRIEAVEPLTEAGGDHDLPVLVPGFHDPHLHLISFASERTYLRLPKDLAGPDDLARRLRQAAAATAPGEWLRVRGFEPETTTDGWTPDRHWLDRHSGEVPVRLQHTSLRMDCLSTAAIRELGTALEGLPGVKREADGHPTGRVYQRGAEISAARPRPAPAVIERRLRDASALLAAAGITSVQDASESNDLAEVDQLVGLAQSGVIKQRLRAMISGAKVGRHQDLGPLERIGHAKLVAIEAQLDLDLLVEQAAAARRHGLPVAIHAATEAEVVAALNTIDRTRARFGPARSGGLDRIEHASISDTGLVEAIAASGAAVVANPGLISRYGDRYLKMTEHAEHAMLHRGQAWIEHRVPLAFASDAPVGPYRPLESVAAAVDRLTPQGQVTGPDERVDELTAIVAASRGAEQLFGLAQPRELVEPGRPADLALIRPGPEDRLSQGRVLLTLLAGEPIHQDESFDPERHLR